MAKHGLLFFVPVLLLLLVVGGLLKLKIKEFEVYIYFLELNKDRISL